MKKKLLLLATCLFPVLMANAESWKTLFFEDFGDVADWPVEKHYERLFYEDRPNATTSSFGRSWYSFPLGRYEYEECGYLAHIKSPMDYYAWPNGTRKPCDVHDTYMPNYVIGGDHTYPVINQKGCFVYAQLPKPTKVIKTIHVDNTVTETYEAFGTFFHKTIDISNMQDATIRASVWMANFSTTKDVVMNMRVLAYSKDGKFTGIGKPVCTSCAKLFPQKNIRLYDWVCYTCSFELDSKPYDRLELEIDYRTPKECYWGIGIDDIKVEFDQSTATAGFDLSKTVRGRNVTINPDITLKRLEDILGTNNGYFYFSWSHIENGVYKTIGGGRINSDADLKMIFSYFDPNTHNGRWKLKIWNNVTSVERYIDLDLKDSDLVRTRTRGIGFDDDEEEVNYDEDQKPNIYNDGTNLYVNGTSENSQIIVYDMSGNAVAYSTTSPVNISVLKKGVYVVDINGTKVKFMKK